MELEDKGEGLDGHVLRGVAASAGRYTGRARVAAKTVEPPDVADGDILVAADAGPAWTPIFPVLGAVVLDSGAGFQHAAVMARELGIPAVLGCRDATSAITDGQTITVDGDAGVVELAQAP
jgi:pyruvate,water dikinase